MMEAVSQTIYRGKHTSIIVGRRGPEIESQCKVGRYAKPRRG